ncbi:MAG TPA: UTP--glucose-1-phosphate uridylyltransferase, partial [Clostridiales bacterium]|nr:UTP--glucose-1-phosphate uridylyltransferase [Clostridiales bacterium]
LLSGKQKEYDAILGIANLASIHYLRQQQPLGLGHAVWCARTFVGNEPFAVLYGDDVVVGDNPACAQLCAAYEEYGLGVAGIKPVSPQLIHKCSSLGVEHLEGNRFKILDMIEKPAPGQELSLYSILGRCVLPPKIFDILEHLPKGAGGEIQLTDAMRVLTQTDGMIGVEYEGTRYDMGSKLGYMQANVEMAAVHPDIGPDFIAYLKEFVKGLS